jgi:hypothetical protein
LRQSKKATVALIGFQKNTGFFARRWQFLGNIGAYQIEYKSIYRSEAAFAGLTLEKQQETARRILKQAEKRGAVWVGVPLVWRSIFAPRTALRIADCRQLMLEQAIKEMSVRLDGLLGRQIAVLKVEDRLARTAVDLLLAAGAKPVLQGKKAASLADFYYQNQGVALPVASGGRLLARCAARLVLKPNTGAKLSDQAFDLSERLIGLAGDFLPPFADGLFPGGLAAALIEAGAKKKEDLPAILDKAGNLAV